MVRSVKCRERSRTRLWDRRDNGDRVSANSNIRNISARRRNVKGCRNGIPRDPIFSRDDQTLNFTKAAEACHVSQPALTRAIRKMEDELGGKLFSREPNNIHMTELGRLIETASDLRS
ncbi:MAG: LysR family transcriptional regulator [Stellaceae bacterium]